MPRKPASEKISKDAIAQYMTADLASLTQRAMHYENILANKINFYLVIVTAAIGGLVLATNVAEIRTFFLLIASLVVIILLMIGWITFLQGLDLSANSTFMYRRMGRIRQWFLDEEPKLFPYLPFSSGDDKPKFYVRHAQWRNVDSILVIVNATLAAGFFVLLWSFLCFQAFHFLFANQTYPYFIALGIGVAIFITFWRIEFIYSKRFMRIREEIERKGNFIHFPTDEIKARFEYTN